MKNKKHTYSHNLKINLNVVLKKISVKKVGHNSEPTQKQNCYCESIKNMKKKLAGKKNLTQ